MYFQTLPAGYNGVVNLGTVLNTALVLISAIGGGVLAYLTTRRNMVSALKEEAAGWARLASMKDAELASMSKRVTMNEEDNMSMRREIGELRSLNISLQKENSDLRQDVAMLHDRINAVERGR